jgi:hypothetical protein
MFDPNLGRWMQNDPIGFEGGDVNLYGYEGENPVRYVDPSGMAPAEYPLIKPRDLTPAEYDRIHPSVPRLKPGDVKVIGEPSDDHNCIAHAVGEKGGRIDSFHPPPKSGIKPAKGETLYLPYVEQVLKFYGFVRSKSCDCEAGKIKVALYGDDLMIRGEKVYLVRHAAVCEGNGPWTSKLGNDIAIQHPNLGILETDPKLGGSYGHVLFCYEKPIDKNPPKK